MTKQEFINLLPEGTTVPEDGEYELIDFVYNWHPSIDDVNGKEHLARLYADFGMRVILDMLVTATKLERLRNELLKLDAEVKRIENEIKDIVEMDI